MKHTTTVVFVCGVTLAMGGAAMSDELVRLKNGAEFRTERHWEEGGLLKFEMRGGVVSFPRDAVGEIVDEDEQPKEATTDTATSGTGEAREAGESTNAAPNTRAKSGGETAPTEAPAPGGDGVSASNAKGADGASGREDAKGAQSAPAEAKNTSDGDVKAAKAPSAGTEVPGPAPGEDLATRVDRLDDMAVHALRDLTEARRRGESQETLDALQDRMKEIARQRADAKKKMDTLR